jgi:integrase
MAINRMKREDGTIYYAVDYRYPRNRDGQRRRETAGTRDEADALWGLILKELLAGRDPRVALGRTGTFEEHAREVLAKHYGPKRCYPWAKIVIECHLIPAFGPLPLSQITAKRILDYTHARTGKGMKPATVNNERGVLSKILSLAVAWDLLSTDANPMRKVPKLEVQNQRDRWLTPEEQRALIGAADVSHIRDAIILALGTGARRAEVLGLRWEDVDLERALVTFRADTTKSGKARTVPANEAVLTVLRARRGDTRNLFARRVITYRGRPLKSLHAGFRSACQAAGIKGATFHSLRHTWATRFGHLGGDPRDLMALGGWSDMKLVERYYHTGAERSARALATMAGDLTTPPEVAAQ